VLLGGAGVILLLFVFFVASYETVHYTESTEFCSTCHTVMEPEVVPHRISAHANVECADCHIGPGIQWKLYYKLSAVRYLWTLPLGLYHRPLASPRETMRSTEEICEQCHATENFQPLSVRTDYEYATDEANTLRRLLLARKIGNGQQPVTGQDLGAHWHVQNPVYFVTTDDFRQNIPWVQVEKNGKTVTYTDSEADPALWANAETQKQAMDCIDCHSREGHTVYKPAEMVDQAMAQGQIASDLPSIKAHAVAVLDQRYETEEAGLEAIVATLTEVYQTQYPDVYGERQAEVEQAIDQVQTIYEQTHFPAMNVYWDTYPNDIGHQDFPGCMRCHNGGHLTDEGEAIPAECNLCHAIPQEAGPDEPLPVLSVAHGEIPESHQSSLWIAQHRFHFDATCDDCHTISDPGGISNSSFCSNSGCHAREWTYLDINAPAVMTLAMPEEQPSQPRLPRIPHPIVEEMACQQCHGPDKVLAYPEDHSEYSQEECTDCHRLAPEVLADITPSPTAPPTVAPPTLVATVAPSITHTLLGNENCLACHAVNGNIAPAPPTHLGFDNGVCQSCHQVALEFASAPAATTTAAAIATSLSPPTVTLTLTATVVEAGPVESSPTVTLTLATVEASPAAPEPTATPAATPASEAATVTVAAPQGSVLSHPLQGNENCLACHAVNSDIAPAPPNHAGFANEQCQGCHALLVDATPTPGDTP
jgi:hypothetical protein